MPRLLVVRPGARPELDGSRRARSARPAAAGRRAGGQRHPGDPGATLSGRRIGRGGAEPAIEATLHRRLDGSRWRAFVKPAKRLAAGDVVRFGEEGKVCFLGQLDATVEAKGEGGEVTLAFAFHGPGARPGGGRARRHAAAALHRRPARRTSATASITRPCSRRRKARSRRRPPGCISPRRWSRGCSSARCRAAQGDAARGGGDVPAGQGGRYRRPSHARGSGQRERGTAAALNAARRAGGRIVAGRLDLAAAHRKRERGRRRDPSVRGRDRAVHHARATASAPSTRC